MPSLASMFGYGDKLKEALLPKIKAQIKAYTPKTPDYATSIPEAYRRYQGMLWGPQGEKGYIAGQVRGASDAMQPYLRQASTQGAANIGARGGLATGSQDWAQSELQGQRVGALSGAATRAQGQVMQANQGLLGMAQGESFRLSDDELRRVALALQKYGMDMSYEAMKDANDKGMIGDIIGGIAQVGGAWLGRG